MERTPEGSGTGSVETRERTRTLLPLEERVLRMRQASPVPPVAPGAPLARAAEPGTELADELLVLELQLVRMARARAARPPSPVKAKIVRALKKRR